MSNKPTVSLFIPCLIDQVYPEIGIDMVKCLSHFGYQIVYDRQQTCCGQPAFNAGHRDEARKVATQFINVFKSSDVIVCPSGSCTAMVKNYYPLLFTEHALLDTARELGTKVFEFSEFLISEDLLEKIHGSYSGKVGFHNSCHSQRELGIDREPQEILQKIDNLELIQPEGEPVCCGFGGLFSFKFDEISATMAKTRLEMFISMGVDTIVTNDPGCLMHMRQESFHRHYELKLLHLIELLAKVLKL
jgi:L-lactate dehydrogenase complex protein LldE